MTTTPILLKGADLFTPEALLAGASVLVADGRIQAVHERTDDPNERPPGTQVIDLKGLKLTPGLIDLHFQGALGHDVWEDDPGAMRAISSGLVRFGVTGFLCTSSFRVGGWFNGLIDMLDDASAQPGAQPLGLYLESPFVSLAKRGGIPQDVITPPSVEHLEEIIKLSRGHLRIMTIAPELPNILDIIDVLKPNSVTPAVGHTNATYEETLKAIDAGANHTTHLYNAMTPMRHREPGAAAALLLDDRVTVEQILDGIHIHPAMIDLAVRLKGPERVAIVTDSIKAAGLTDGDYIFGDSTRTVHVVNGAPRLDDGRLAGSSLTMDRALRNMITMIGREPLDAVRMATLTPAAVLNLDKKKGRIEPNCDADLVVFDEDWSVRATMIAGEFVFNDLGRTG